MTTDPMGGEHNQLAGQEATGGAPQPDMAARHAEAMSELMARQNLALAIVAGLVTSLVSAGIWAFVTKLTEYQIGYMAIGVGFLVGFAVRFAGHGVTPVFGFVGAGFSLLGCILGNLFAGCAFIAAAQGVSFWDVVGGLDFELAKFIMTEMFGMMDLVFYAIAVYVGFKSSFDT